MVYKDNASSFEDLLKRVSVHHKNIQFLPKELFKVKLGIAPPLMEEYLGEETFPKILLQKISDHKLSCMP